MNCKNCEALNTEEANFCQICGAKVVTKRANTLDFIKGFFIFFINWDNSYIRTFRDLFVCPHIVMEAYISGVRRRYVPPIVFLAVGTAIGMLVYNTFSDEYINMSSVVNEAQFEFFEQLSNENNGEVIFDKEQLIEDTRQSQLTFLNYFNVVTFILIPFYAFISMLVFGWKRINFAEHLIINCYIQGLSLFIGTIVFLISIYTTPKLPYYQILVLMIYYLAVYSLLLKLSFFGALVKLLKFIGILIALIIVLSILGVIAGILWKVIFG